VSDNEHHVGWLLEQLIQILPWDDDDGVAFGAADRLPRGATGGAS
jgi:hypothetical protein